MFKFNNEILKECQKMRLTTYEQQCIEKLEKIKKELQSLGLNKEMLYMKASEYVETTNQILEIEKELEKFEKGATNNDKSTNEK